MPSKRRRRAHGTTLSDEILSVLGMGTGINYMSDHELRAMWQQWGPQVTEYFQRTYGDEPFCAWLAREEGWWDASETTT